MTIFKVHCDKLALKIYSKGERVLRVESMTRSSEVLKCGRSVDEFTQMVQRLKAILERFIESLSCMDQCFIADMDVESLPSYSVVGSTRVGGIEFNRPRIWRVARALLALSAQPRGFTASQLACHVRSQGNEDFDYGPRQAAYDLKKFRGKAMVQCIGKSRRYEPTPRGLATISASWLLREKVIGTLIGAFATGGETAMPTANPVALDQRYETVRKEMRAVLQEMGFAA